MIDPISLATLASAASSAAGATMTSAAIAPVATGATTATTSTFLGGFGAGSLGALGLEAAKTVGAKANMGAVAGHVLTGATIGGVNAAILGSQQGGGGGLASVEGGSGGRALPMSGVDPQGPKIVPFEQRVAEVLGSG